MDLMRSMIDDDDYVHYAQVLDLMTRDMNLMSRIQCLRQREKWTHILEVRPFALNSIPPSSAAIQYACASSLYNKK